MSDTKPTKVELARLRGGIESGNVGSRGLAAHLASPCQRARTLIAVGTSPRKAAKTTHGVESTNEPSRIAAEVGQIFERSLVGRNGERLIGLYVTHTDPGVRLTDGTTMVDCGDENFDENDPALRMQKFVTQTIEVVKGVYAVTQEGRSVILTQPTFELLINGFPHYVRPDLMICTGNEWYVGEIKVYLDRDGETSGIEVSSTVKQAAVGVLAAQATLTKYGFDIKVSPLVDVIFRKHSIGRASVTRLNAEAEIETLSAGIRNAEELLTEWKDKVVSLDTAESIEKIPNFYTDSCAKSCEYNEVCRSQKEQDEGRILHEHPGVVVTEVAGVTGQRALELASGENPIDRNETLVSRWLRSGWEATR